MKKFVAGVGKTFNYASDGTLLWQGKTNISSAIEVTTGSENVTAGQGNALQMIFYHTSEMSVSQEDQQFNLSMIAKSLGSEVVTGHDVWKEETVTITGGAGSVDGTPVNTFADAIYGWVDLADGSTERVEFTGQEFNVSGQNEGVVCVRYYEEDTSARQVEVPANIIPSVVRCVIEAQLFSGDPQNIGASSLIGKVQIEVPRLQLGGTASLNLTTTGVSSTPVSGNALASEVPGCTASGIYATITEIVDSANWYDNVTVLAPTPDPLEMGSSDSETLVVYAIPNNGDAPFVVKNEALTFTSDTVGVATVGENTGLVEAASSGNATITVAITEKTDVTATVSVEIS